ncbi:hypothetical protein A9Z65_07195 [Moraxella nonliquefaciens]|nr:hypothetical protein A9Z65_07195 [Moraxella nonliquefaciens]
MKELVKTILVIILFLPFYHSLLFNDNLQNHVRKPYIIMTKFTGFSKSFASHFKVVLGIWTKNWSFLRFCGQLCQNNDHIGNFWGEMVFFS